MRRKMTISGVVFDASAKTLDFSAFSGFSIERLMAVINGSTLIYAVGTDGLGYASVADDVVTLEADTTDMDDDDPLTVLYEADDTAASDASLGGAAAAAAGDTGASTTNGFLRWLRDKFVAGITAIPIMTSGGHVSAQTNADGSTFTAFGSKACHQLTIINGTGTNIEVRQGSETVYLPVFDSTGYTFYGLSNANQLAVRRVDLGTTQVTVKARWEA